MEVTYSIAAKLGGHGIGAQALRTSTAIYRAGFLNQVLASYEDQSSIPAEKVKSLGIVGKALRRLAYLDPTGYGYILHDNAFDSWAATRISKCTIFHGWNHHARAQMRKAKSLGAVAVVERASSHILQGMEIYDQEYKKYGVRYRFFPPRFVQKCLEEYELADYVTVPSEYAYNSFVNRGYPKEKLILIPFGVDHENFFESKLQSSINSGLRVSGVDRFIVLYVGDVRLGKGVQYLLEAWNLMNMPEAELWVVGGIKHDMRRMIVRYSRNPRIKFLGFRRDINELMRQADVFAFPSLDEGSALVTYEAMASGLPVVTTLNAGSLVRDSIDGYIVPVMNCRALAERIEYFYNYPAEAKRMGQSGAERVANYTWGRYCENLLSSYKSMLR